MKTIHLISIYALLLCACDSPDLISEPEMLSYSENLTVHKGSELPFNTANAYDYAGRAHSDIFNSYYDSPLQPGALDSIIARVSNEMAQHSFFRAINTYNYHQFSSSYIDSILQQPTTRLQQALDASGLSTAAKDSLENFIDDLFLKINAKQTYPQIYDFIVGYETTVIGSKTYTSNDSAFILAVTSIARHSIYHKGKKPKPNPQPDPDPNPDPDWDWLTTCIVGSIDGAGYGIPESIDLALKTGIAAD